MTLLLVSFLRLQSWNLAVHKRLYRATDMGPDILTDEGAGDGPVYRTKVWQKWNFLPTWDSSWMENWTRYHLSTSCQFVSPSFCKKNIFLQYIPPSFSLPECLVEPVELWENDTNCYLDNNCTMVSCCLDDEVTGKSYQVSVEILTCDNKLLVTLERRTLTLPLHQYANGATHSIRLFGVFILE